MAIHIINGPNLNLVGQREPAIYGSTPLKEAMTSLKQQFAGQIELVTFQSNHEGELVDKLQELGFGESRPLGIVLNAGALGHTSLALGDCIKAIETPVIDVHISNVYAREAFRQNSFVTPACVGSISGLGLEGYRLAVDWFLRKHTSKNN